MVHGTMKGGSGVTERDRFLVPGGTKLRLVFRVIAM
ncbi:Protein CBG25602 [Caenorhabditis briggsae]|uniref:Protein CBG25602 n=1 Tax=Caenorhabditis briggsae TaxID=6238 RepID=B6IF86_CAEBR|nr:Protein CBG25602 [Caenorhabditis briggsae]CAR98566.1 Protein CBG25602 [Caenorhabditis briggsae]